MRKITASSKWTFGKHKGIKLRDTPSSYLHWAVQNLTDSDCHNWALGAQQELERRQNDDTSSGDAEERANEMLRQYGIDPYKI